MAARGSLMRLAPVAIRFHSHVEAAAGASATSSRTTHAARRPVDACRILGAMTAALIAGHSPGDVLSPDFWTYGPLHPAVDTVARGSWQRRQPADIRGSGSSAAAFEEAILRAANVGDSADRIVSLAGALHAAATARDPASAWDHEHTVHGGWVEPGLLTGEYPGATDQRRARHKVNVLVDAGVRTGTVIGCPLAPRGHDYDDILERIRGLRSATRNSHRSCLETSPQLDVLRRRTAS